MSSAPSRSRQQRASLPRLALWLVVLALVAVQTLSLLHGVAHAGRAGQAGAEGQAATTAAPGLSVVPMQQGPARGASSWFDALFGGHGGPECKAFDQAAHADFIGPAAAGLEFPAPATALAFVHVAWHLAAQARGFLARGPPVAA